ncbi:TRAP transporter small permease [Jannaschia sp.]|nr:TRAP transporter small permease [Jannaschia sp.]
MTPSQAAEASIELIWIARLRRINAGIAIATGVMLLACAAFVLSDIVLRGLGLHSFGGTEEYAGYAMALATAWGMAYTLLELGHVRIDILRAKGGTRLRAMADILSLSILSATVVFIAVKAWPILERSLSNGSRANTPLETPLAWAQVPWFAGWVWFALVSCALTALAVSMALRGQIDRTEAVIGAFAEQDILQ